MPPGDMPVSGTHRRSRFRRNRPPTISRASTIDDLIDFTPELRQEAIAILSRYRYGPMFTPPSVAGMAAGTKGTVLMPGAAGGSNWTGAGVDPETGMLYVTSVHSPFIAEMIKAQDPRRRSVNHPTGAAAADCGMDDEARRRRDGPVAGRVLSGLPIFKPPYGRLVAIDLNKGDILWTAANGNGPRDHPAIKHFNLPPLGQGGPASPLVTRRWCSWARAGTTPSSRFLREAAGKCSAPTKSRPGRVTLGDGTGRRHDGRANELHVRGQAVHRGRHGMEGNGERTRRAGVALEQLADLLPDRTLPPLRIHADAAGAATSCWTADAAPQPRPSTARLVEEELIRSPHHPHRSQSTCRRSTVTMSFTCRWINGKVTATERRCSRAVGDRVGGCDGMEEPPDSKGSQPHRRRPQAHADHLTRRRHRGCCDRRAGEQAAAAARHQKQIQRTRSLRSIHAPPSPGRRRCADGRREE